MKKIMTVLFLIAVSASVCFPGSCFSEPSAWPKEIRLGLIPTEGGADIVKRFKPLIAHLENTLDIKVKGVSASDYAGLITAMSHKHLDFAYFGPKSYVEAAEKADAEALALELNKQGEGGYYGIIITRKDSGIKTISQARNHVFAFTDPNSTSGCLVPNILFARDLKVKPENYFREVRFSGSHGASILAVKNGSIDVAATNNIDFDRMAEKGQVSHDEFRILWKSDMIPGAPMAARKDLPPSLKAAFTGALMSFNRNHEGLEKLQNGGYGFADDSTYDVVRYLKRLKKELSKG